MQLSLNFTLEELTDSSRHPELVPANIKEAEEKYLHNIELLVNKILQPLRDYLKRAVTVTSGYRGTLLNSLVNGKVGSDHTKGLAADTQVKGLEAKELFEIILNHADEIFDGWLDKCILEEIGEKKWVHLTVSLTKEKARKHFYITDDGIHYKRIENLTTKDNEIGAAVNSYHPYFR